MSDLSEALERYDQSAHKTYWERFVPLSLIVDAARNWDNLTSPENVERVSRVIDRNCFEIAEGVLFDDVAKVALEAVKGTE